MSYTVHLIWMLTPLELKVNTLTSKSVSFQSQRTTEYRHKIMNILLEIYIDRYIDIKISPPPPHTRQSIEKLIVVKPFLEHCVQI